MAINLTMFVSPMGGHDVNRISAVLKRWMERNGLFRVTLAGTCPGAGCGIEQFMDNEEAVNDTRVFFFLCPDDHWSCDRHRRRLEAAVSQGAGIVFYHGLHPCFSGWPEAERMIGLLWRETALHCDYHSCHVSITGDHPITRGITDFDTNDEIFCRLTNVWNVPMDVLATAYSDDKLYSRWSVPGTGREEPILTVGSYGKGRTVDFLLGHVWNYYTGHGLLENTLAALEPPQFQTLLLRSCEWAATGQVIQKDEKGETL